MNAEHEILIQKYLDNLLSENDEKLFNSLLKDDLEFRKKVKLEISLKNTLDEKSWSFIENSDSSLVREYQSLYQQTENKQLKDIIISVQEDYKNSFRPKKRRFAYYSIAVIAILICTILLFPSRPSNQELYSKYLDETELLSLVNRNDTNETFSKSQIAFDREDYEMVIRTLLPEINDLNSSNAYLYLAISQTKVGKEKDAENTLNNLISSDLLDAQKGYWYKSLLFLKLNRIEDVKKELKLIIEKNYFKSQEAQELLNKLD